MTRTKTQAPTLAPFPPPPDIEGEGVKQHHPLIFGSEIQEITPNTIKVIRKNAGRVPVDVLKRALCWSERRLRRVARAHSIDLRCPPHENEPEPVGA